MLIFETTQRTGVSPVISQLNVKIMKYKPMCNSGVLRNFFGRGVQQIQLRTEGRENGDLKAVAP
jgi:hypothetical protein